MAYVFRPISDADRPTAVRFLGALQEFERSLHESRVTATALVESHLAWLEGKCAKADGRAELAWTESGEAVGLLIYLVEEHEGHYLRPDYGRAGWILDIWIEPDHRGGPLLDQMMEHAAAHFRALGLTRLMLGYLDGNDRALAAYRKRGFKPFENTLERAL